MSTPILSELSSILQPSVELRRIDRDIWSAMPEGSRKAPYDNRPFTAGSFSTLSCPGVLHLFEEPALPARKLLEVAGSQAGLYFTSLVTLPERRFAAAYLRGKHRAVRSSSSRVPSGLASRREAPLSSVLAAQSVAFHDWQRLG